MSVLVKGMKMPDSCAVCRFAGKGGYHMERVVCMFTGKNEDAQNVDRLSDCPLIALPDKHGRLVDADEIRGRMESVFNISSHLVTGHTWGEAYAGGFSDAIDIVKDAPTIVEAEDRT